ncbi:hypothetical protein [Laspinema olomoucense]|uniref:hypothetical protein n=1 Tax=Laspinema olomoucense TaxID=3231600 RepID=UPI0021BB70B0|nr:hypothetical protein [Laspinema sp. D3b]MCT7989017.1 hypothetical protein [Laspinema sp. D3a]
MAPSFEAIGQPAANGNGKMAPFFEVVGYLRGTGYELNKHFHGSARFSSAQNEHLKTSE